MSSLCLVNLKQNNIKDFNSLLNKLKLIVLKYDLGLLVNAEDFGKEIIESGKMQSYFFISDNFLYPSSELFNLQPLMLRLCGTDKFENVDFDRLPSENEFHKAFLEQYNFFNEIINCLFEFDISLIEIYITANYGPTYFYEDFLEVKSSRENFLNDLYDTLSDELCNNFNYEFTSVKIEIAK